MKQALTIFAATLSALAIIGCEVEEPKRKPPLPGSPVEPSKSGGAGGKTCEDDGKVTSGSRCITQQEACVLDTTMKWEGGTCVPINPEPSPEEKCRASGKVWSAEKQTCDEPTTPPPPAPNPVPNPVSVPGASQPVEPAPEVPAPAPAPAGETIQKKALKATFLVSTKAEEKNCYLPVGALVTMQTDKKPVAQNPAQATATITKVEGATCALGVWSYFQEHLK